MELVTGKVLFHTNNQVEQLNLTRMIQLDRSSKINLVCSNTEQQYNKTHNNWSIFCELIDKNIIRLVKKMLVIDPKKRITAKKLLVELEKL